MSDIPPELLFGILLFLPPEDLLRCRCVCKAWKASINDQRFIQAHLQRSIKTNFACNVLVKPADVIHYPKEYFSLALYDNNTLGPATKVAIPLELQRRGTTIVGSCNGLVCIRNSYTGLVLWNPSIQKFTKIWLTTLRERLIASRPRLIYGFGYDSINDDYKIVVLVHFRDRDRVLGSPEVNVYSLKYNSLKRIQTPPCSVGDGLRLASGEVLFLNGALHWVMRKYQLVSYLQVIVSLDLSSETYREFPLGSNFEDYKSFVVVGAYLCICCFRPYEREEGWIMKEYGVTESWALLYSLDLRVHPYLNFVHLFVAQRVTPSLIIPSLIFYHVPLLFSKNGEKVLVKRNDGMLLWFDLEKGSEDQQVEIHRLPPWSGVTCVIQSLCLLDGDPVNC